MTPSAWRISPLSHDAIRHVCVSRQNTFLVFCLVLVMVLLPSSDARSADPDLQTIDRWTGGMLQHETPFTGAASCASSGCHGGPRPGVANPRANGGNEYLLWMENDPHAQSWRTIASEQSVAMMDRLGILRDGRIVDIDQFNNCLACHNSAPVDPPAAATRDHAGIASEFSARSVEGVGCRGCHGPSSKWETSHYLAGWSPGDATETGFVPAANLLVRARMCASCHVGDRDRDMNHDIIAAGHPPLRFEMATYHNRLPKHWRDPQASNPGQYEMDLWIAGAIASSDAWLALLEGRAAGSTAVSTWPEFASYDCSSCHHALGLNNRRNPLSDPSRRGLAKQSQWDTFALRNLLADVSVDVPSGSAAHSRAVDLARNLVTLRKELESDYSPSRGDVAALAKDSRRTLLRWTESNVPNSTYKATGSGPWDAPQLRIDDDRLLSIIRRTAERDSTFDTWESAAGYYLMMVASRHRWPDARWRTLAEQTNQMRRGLAFAPESSSPEYATAQREGTAATREEIQQLADQFVRDL
jgi:hypothetical protein